MFKLNTVTFSYNKFHIIYTSYNFISDNLMVVKLNSEVVLSIYNCKNVVYAYLFPLVFKYTYEFSKTSIL